jgi:hypothetical protein
MGGRQAFRLLIVGKSGSGKSALAWEVIWRRPHARGDGWGWTGNPGVPEMRDHLAVVAFALTAWARWVGAVAGLPSLR